MKAVTASSPGTPGAATLGAHGALTGRLQFSIPAQNKHGSRNAFSVCAGALHPDPGAVRAPGLQRHRHQHVSREAMFFMPSTLITPHLRFSSVDRRTGKFCLLCTFLPAE